MPWASFQEFHTLYGQPTLTVRPMRDDERPAAWRAGARAFNQNTEAWYPEGLTMIGLTPAGEIVSSLELNPRPMWFGAGQVPACSVGGVATDPAHHRSGYAGALLIGTIHHFRERGWHLCPLWPFSYAFYRKFGWDITVPDVQARTNPQMLRRIEADPTSVRPATPDDLPALHACYHRTAKQYNGRTAQDESWWTGRVMAGDFPVRCLVHESETGAVDGFATYRHWPMHLAEGLRVRVMELQADSLAAQKALVRAVAEIPNAAQIEFLLPHNTLLPDMLPDRLGLDLPQRLAVRVIDPAPALAGLRPPEELKGKLSFEITDWIVAGEKPIALTAEIEGGRVTVTAGAGADALRCPINIFSRLFMGAINAEQARGLGGLAGGNAAADRLCDALLHGRTPFRSELETG